ncbi:hypothetical protein [Streptomyces sp. NPDC002537]
MSVLTAVHVRRLSARHPGTARAAFTSFAAFLVSAARRIADSPLESSIVRAVPATAPAAGTPAADRPVRPHAHWRAVTGPGGRRHLEAAWHVNP